MNKLWTKNFSLITLGTIVSMLGNTVASFSIGLLIYEITKSTFLFAVYTIATTIPRIILPLIAGPLIDRLSKKKIIVFLDYTSGIVFGLVAISLFLGIKEYSLFLVIGILLGSIDSIYNVAYESFYPTLISKGNYTKAYSISSMIYPIASTVMVPIAAFFYENIGIEVLFVFNALTFLLTASFELFIDTDRPDDINVQHNLKQFSADFKDGLKYLKKEKGLGTITAYFFVSTLCGAIFSTLLLPFFKTTPDFSVMQYSWLMSISTFGRLLGAAAHYLFRYPTNKKYFIAVTVYISICILDGSLLFLPFAAMMVFQFLTGLLSVTSYTIRISTTQNYVPKDKRGRFNGVFMVVTNIGAIVGQFIGGTFGEFVEIRYIIAIAMAIQIAAVSLIMIRNRRHVKLIYNQRV